jgi:CBS domain-containing protein
MKVSEAMTCNVTTLAPDQSLREAALVLAEQRISGAPVVNREGEIVGVFSEADVLAKERAVLPQHGLIYALRHPEQIADEELRLTARWVADAMTMPAVTISARSSVAEAAALMLDRRVKRLPVVDDGKLVGIVTRTDLVRAFVRSDAAILEEVREEIVRRTLWISPSTIGIEVRNGVVTLAGEVETETDAELLTDYVRRVPGVVDIRSTVHA